MTLYLQKGKVSEQPFPRLRTDLRLLSVSIDKRWCFEYAYSADSGAALAESLIHATRSLHRLQVEALPSLQTP